MADKGISAGLLLFRRRDGAAEVFLAHPGGPAWRNKDEGAWTIPKGLVDEGEDLLVTAAREFREETGIEPKEPYIPLGSVTQKAGKIVHAWAWEGDADPAQVKSNTFRMVWPPRSGNWITCPEVDRCAWFDLGEARRRVNPAQAAFLDALEAALNGGQASQVQALLGGSGGGRAIGKINWWWLLGCVVAIELIGSIGSFATAGSVDTWYQTIQKPAFNPPSWVFGPVWTTLFAFMGVALYVVWSRGLEQPGVKLALGLFAAQMVLNVLWSFLIFEWHLLFWSSVEIVLLFALILATLIAFWKVKPLAGWLLVPYLLWVGFATLLNISIWQLNS